MQKNKTLRRKQVGLIRLFQGEIPDWLYQYLRKLWMRDDSVKHHIDGFKDLAVLRSPIRWWNELNEQEDRVNGERAIYEFRQNGERIALVPEESIPKSVLARLEKAFA